MKYRKGSVVIEAWQFSDTKAGFDDLKAKGIPLHCFIPTLEGNMCISDGDWIIRGVKGEFYPCKPDIFEATYEKADEAALVSDDGPHDYTDVKAERFRKELQALLNSHCMEMGRDTPDFILAQFLLGCLKAFNAAVNVRTGWYKGG